MYYESAERERLGLYDTADKNRRSNTNRLTAQRCSSRSPYKKFFFEVNPSCGRWLASARCHRGGSPRASPRAASSPRDALATPHPGKRNDRAPPPPASPRRAAPRRASPRLAAAHAHTHPRARARSARAKQPSKRVSSREPKGPSSNREPVRPPPLAVLQRHSRAVPHIT